MTESIHKWFSAVIAYEIRVAGVVSEHRSLSLMLVRAADEATARQEAERLGSEENIDYPNSDGETVSWSWTDVLEVQSINDEQLVEGSEVYSCMVSAELFDDIKAQLLGGHS